MLAHWMSIWMDSEKLKIALKKIKQKLSTTHKFISHWTCVHVEKSKHMNKLMKNPTQIHASLESKQF